MTRFPEPGAVKTRLSPTLGAEGAARLHEQMTEHTVQCARRLAAKRECAVTVCFAGGDSAKMAALFGSDVRYREQGPGDLGAKLLAALREAVAAGADRICAIGADCPDLDEASLDHAFDRLDRSDVVIGPATDGGYYLIGVRSDIRDQALRSLFANITWGTSAVYTQTLDRIESAGMTVSALGELSDVDGPEDLPVWERHVTGDPRPAESQVDA